MKLVLPMCWSFLVAFQTFLRGFCFQQSADGFAGVYFIYVGLLEQWIGLSNKWANFTKFWLEVLGFLVGSIGYFGWAILVVIFSLCAHPHVWA